MIASTHMDHQVAAVSREELVELLNVQSLLMEEVIAVQDLLLVEVGIGPPV